MKPLFTRLVGGVTLGLAIGFALMIWSMPAPTQSAPTASTFTVTSPADVVDAHPGDGVCDTGGGVCTLRAAIMEANTTAGATINFGLPGQVTYTLSLGALVISNTMSINGNGPGNTIIDGNGSVTSDRVMTIITHTVSIAGVKITNGKKTFTGTDPNAFAGGILHNDALTLTNTVVSGNTALASTGAAYGGGIYSSGPLTLINSVVASNLVTTTSGGIASGGGVIGNGTYINSTISGNTARDSGGGVLGGGTFVNSTISGNTARLGGGINGGAVTLTNSTVSGNNAKDLGGGIYHSGGTMSLLSVTIAQNLANSDASGFGEGAGIYNASGTVNFQNTIIGNNTLVIPTTPLPTASAEDCSGTLTSQGYNIVSETVDCTINGSFTQASPLLGALQANGGPTFTHALQAGSPAIDAGNPGGCTDPLGAILTTDQRGTGYLRVVNGRCDIGAYEFGALPTPTPTITPSPTRTSTPTIALTPSRTPTQTATPPAGSALGNLRFITPVRVLDTRPGSTVGFNPDGSARAAGRLADGATIRAKLAGQTFGGTLLPADLTGVLVNVTLVQDGPSGGFVTVFPGDVADANRPNASTLNPSTAIAANFWTVMVPTAGTNAGTVAVFSNGASRDVILDVVGYFAPSNPPAPTGPGNLKLVTPVRVLDTRSAAASGNPGTPIGFNPDGSAVQAAPLVANVARRFLVAGRTFGSGANAVSFPADTAGILAHVTTVQGQGSGGFVTLLPGDAPSAGGIGAPSTSSVNPSTAIAFNGAAVGIPTAGGGGVAGTFALYSTNSLDVVVDVVGYWAPSNPAAGGTLTLVTPGRVLDTRPAAANGTGPIGFKADGSSVTVGQLTSGSLTPYSVGGRSFPGGLVVPADAKGVLVNVTLVQGAPGGGFIAVLPGDVATAPIVSAVNPSTAIAASFWATGLSQSGAPGLLEVASVGDPRDVALDIIGYLR